MTKDDTRGKFLTALKDARDAGKVRLTSFENGFVDDCYDAFNFSPKMRSAIDKMIAKYAAAIGFHDSKSTLAALAKKEEDKMRAEQRARQCVAVGGKLVRGTAKRVTAAQYKHP
jgi:hypothetical protein